MNVTPPANTACHIVGAGAIGGLFASRLSAAGFQVTLIERNAHVGQRTLRLITDGQEELLTVATEPVNALRPIDLLWVCTKSHAVMTALAAIEHRLSPDALVVTLSNGMGFHEMLAEKLMERVIAGSTTAGVARVDEDTHLVAGQGETRLGWWHGAGSAPRWYPALAAANWHCQWEPDIHRCLLEKLALNGVINPATALLDIKNGALLQPEHSNLLARATDELCAQLLWAGHPEIAADLPTRLQQVLQDTATNSSSMRTDRQLGNVTEHEAILGYLLDRFGPEQRDTRPPAPLLESWLSALRRAAPIH